MASAIALRGLSCGYGDRAVLESIELDVQAGSILGLLGPNGCGKSTLLKTLGGLLRPLAGYARLDGIDIDRIRRRDLARQVAVVPQEPRFGFPFTALEVVLMGRHPHLGALAFESAADIDIARSALQRCGAAELAARPIHELSSGERQRVVFARALAQAPRVLLLDEPASFLDIRHQVALYDVVRELAAEGCTVISALHDLNLAAEYCTEIALLGDGRLAHQGPPADVMTYANLTAVFETEIYVDVNDLTGKPLLAPLSGVVANRLRARE